MDEFMRTTKNAGHVAELKRLSDNHEVIKDAMNGLLLAPIDLSTPGLRILDSATADGLWLRDLRASSAVPHQYVGTDIEPELFPSNLPQGLTLAKQSMDEPWASEWNDTFDLVHQRFGLANAVHVPHGKVVEYFAGLCKPGGWIELVELDVNTSPPDSGPALNELMRLMREIFSAIGVGGDFASKLKSLLESAGLENVEERRVECKIGVKAKPHLVQKSINAVCGAVAPLAAVAKSVSTSFRAEELSTLEPGLREELETRGGAYGLFVVYGRKPRAE